MSIISLQCVELGYAETAAPLFIANSGHSNGVTALAIQESGHLLATAGMDRSIRIWDQLSGRIVRILEGIETLATSVDFVGKGLIVAKDVRGKVIAWDLNSGKLIWKKQLSESAYVHPTVHPLGFILERSQQGDHIWKAVDIFGVQDDRVFTFDDEVSSVIIDSAATRIAATMSSQQTLEVSTSSSRSGILSLAVNTKLTGGMRFSHDGRRIAVLDVNNNVIVWDSTSGEKLIQASCPGRNNISENFSYKYVFGFISNESFVIAQQKLVRVIDIKTNIVVWEKNVGSHNIYSEISALETSSKGTSVVAAVDDGALEMSAADGSVLRTFGGISSRITAVNWALEGKRLGTLGLGEHDPWVMWDLLAGSPRFLERVAGSQAVAFSGNLTHIAAADSSGAGENSNKVTLVTDGVSLLQTNSTRWPPCTAHALPSRWPGA